MKAINLYTTIPDNEIITEMDAAGRTVLKKEIIILLLQPKHSLIEKKL
jgi:hypothetical protein